MDKPWKDLFLYIGKQCCPEFCSQQPQRCACPHEARAHGTDGVRNVAHEQRTWKARFLSQKEQSAAPPAIVPIMYFEILITFLTVPDPAHVNNAKHVHHTNVRTHGGTRIDSNQDAMVENESQGRSTVVKLNRRVGGMLEFAGLK